MIGDFIGADPYIKEGSQQIADYNSEVAFRQLDVLGILAGIGIGAKVAGVAAKGAARGPVTLAEKIRDIEARVRRGDKKFPPGTREALDEVVDRMAENIRRQLNRGNSDRAADVAEKMKGAICRLGRFDAVSPEVRDGMKSALDTVLEQGS